MDVPPPPEHSFHVFQLGVEQNRAIDRLSKVENLQQRLENIAKRDWTSKSPDVIWKSISRYLTYIPLMTGTCLPFDIDQIKVYRCRKNIDSNVESLNLWSTYSCPPPAFCGRNGRANVAGSSVFYGSDSPMAAIAETRPKVGDKIFHTEWLVRSFRQTTRTVMFSKDIPKGNPWRTAVLNKIGAQIHGYNQTVGKDMAKPVLQILSFLSEVFTKEKEPYPVSSAIANQVLFQGGVDYILYPSFQINSHASNMAFHPNFVYSCMFLNKVLLLEIQGASESGVEVKHVKTGHALYNHILWGPPHPEELDFMDNNNIT